MVVEVVFAAYMGAFLFGCTIIMSEVYDYIQDKRRPIGGSDYER